MKFTAALFGVLCGVVKTSSYDISNVQDVEPMDQCTAILVTKEAAAEGVGSMTTHTNDCLDCDFRLAKVPAMDHPEGSMRKIWGGRAQYPRYIGDDRGDVYYKESIVPDLYDWGTTQAVGYIPQVAHTYAYLDGDYGIQNEHQLSMGESTCGGKAELAHAPTFDGGHALLEMSELSRIAMERCKTARCAVQLMGDLAVEYGFYGAVWKGDPFMVEGEAGEAMTVTDKTESWMFHITGDDTGKSACWLAQRVPEGHVTVVANGFVIKEFDLTDSDNFLGSDNLYEVAERAGLWTPGEHMSYLEVFGMNRGHLSTYVNRRMWRVLDMVAPSLKLSPHSDIWARNYPFSVKAEKPLTVADIETIQRDYYEGTEFDTSSGPMGGPYGNPARYDPGTVDGMTHPELMAGRFERTISLFRTSYSFVTQSREHKPDVLSLVWFGQFTPHSTVYIPVYTHVSKVADSLSRGALQVLDRGANWWAFSAVGNYAAQWFKFTQPDVVKMQKKFEDAWFENQEAVEELGLSIGGYGGDVAIVGYLTDWCNEQAADVLDTWWKFLDVLMAKFRDGYIMQDIHTETLSPTKIFFPRWWLESVGFWGKAASGGSTSKEAMKNNKGEFENEIIWDEEPKKEAKKEEEKEKKGKEKEAKKEAKKDGEVEPMLGAAGPAQTGGHGGIIFASIFVGAIMGAFGKTYLDKRNANYIPI
ncbi:hypothetical protein TrCOL_g10016 [Triparma columacea]|uniref:Dipeptidase n=1 Tax=Triparma columacea TaxID=722753 RepID=A0A9W7L9V1_9STRA|nr:hypothetical protein TrCOL_g10016 [Triparma columacea]